MKVKTISITGFRQLREIEINLEDNLTFIAGANNSGKTSLVELLTRVFCVGSSKACCDDYSIQGRKEWSNEALASLVKHFSEYETQEERIGELMKEIFPQDGGVAKIIEPISVRIQVDYETNVDDIRMFADYIMEIGEDDNSFYFMYRHEVNQSTFLKALIENYSRLDRRFALLDGTEADVRVNRIIGEMLVDILLRASEERVYYCNKSYEIIEQFDVSSFRRLFHFNSISAGRKLDDQTADRQKGISKAIIDIASKEESWDELMRSLPDQILEPIQSTDVQNTIRSESIAKLDEVLKDSSETSGGHTADLALDADLTEDAVQSLLTDAICAKYNIDGHYLREGSQGLGYSNLIYLHLQLEIFLRSCKPLLANLIIVEEPEAHMHPQMQAAFIKYLVKYYETKKDVQVIVTTHSSEVVRQAKIPQLRVLRHIDLFHCGLYDLRRFYDGMEGEKDILDFYTLFYAVNFPDIIFADRVIMYEGDTERMLIKSVLNNPEFEKLRVKYLSFVQVGGAYAINYKPLIDFLDMSTVILTDLDYSSEASTLEEVLASETTNATINNLAKECIDNENPSVAELLGWKGAAPDGGEGLITTGDFTCLAFQGKDDGYSRTLEEAMLSRLYDIDCYEQKDKAFWTEKREADKLKFVIPNKETSSIRDIVKSTSNKKTDFMYSVIMNSLDLEMLPPYIAKALEWLAVK